MSQLPSKPGILSLISQLLAIEWTILECYFMEKSWWLSYLGSMFLEIFNRTSYCKDTNGFMQKNMLCVMFVFNFWGNGFRNVHFLMASIENHPFDLLIHKEKFLQGYTLRLEAQFKESGKVHQSTTTPTNLRPWTVTQNSVQKYTSNEASKQCFCKFEEISTAP